MFKTTSFLFMKNGFQVAGRVKNIILMQKNIIVCRKNIKNMFKTILQKKTFYLKRNLYFSTTLN